MNTIKKVAHRTWNYIQQAWRTLKGLVASLNVRIYIWHAKQKETNPYYLDALIVGAGATLQIVIRSKAIGRIVSEVVETLLGFKTQGRSTSRTRRIMGDWENEYGYGYE